MTDTTHLDEWAPQLSWLRQARPGEYRAASTLLGMFRDFRREVVDAYARRIDEASPAKRHELIREVLAEAARRGLLSATLPPVFGGRGLPFVGLMLGLEELASGCAGIANLVSVHGLGLSMISALGHARLLAEVCRAIAEGEAKGQAVLLATAVTEPGAGTDMEALELLAQGKSSNEATKVTGGYRLNGRKVFISNGHLARYLVVVMPTDRKDPVATLTAFLVELPSEGFTVERVEEKMGQKACPAAALLFEDCFVPDERRLGAVTSRVLDLVLGSTRAAVATYGCGIARAALDTAQRWARSGAARVPLPAARQSTRQQLADLQASLWGARAAYLDAWAANEAFGLSSVVAGMPLELQRRLPRRLLDNAATRRLTKARRLDSVGRWAIDALPEWGVNLCAARGASAKVAASELSSACCQQVLDLMGGEGTRPDWQLGKLLRDAKLLEIYEGTNDLNRLEVAAKLGGDGLLDASPATGWPNRARLVERRGSSSERDADALTIAQLVRRWCRERVLPAVDNTTHEHPTALFDEAFEMGLGDLGTEPDDAEGPRGVAAALRALGELAPAIGAVVLAHHCARRVLGEAGRRLEAERCAWLAFPAYDVAHDPRHLLTCDRGVRRLTGKVPLVVGAGLSPHLVLPWRAVDDPGHHWLCLGAATAGVRITRVAPLLGLEGCPVADVEVDIPVEAVESVECDLRNEPPSIDSVLWSLPAALGHGVMLGSIELAGEYCRHRMQSGRAIVEHDAVAQHLARMTSAESVSSALLDALCQSSLANSDAIALLLAARPLWLDATSRGIQVLGGYGYIANYGQERRFRDARQAACLLGSTHALRQAPLP